MTGKTCQHLEDAHSVAVVLTLRQRHKSGRIDGLTHLQAKYRTLDSFVSAWSTLKRLDEGGGQLGKPQLENGRKLGFRAESPLPLGADDPTPNWTDLLSDLLSHEQVDFPTNAITEN